MVGMVFATVPSDQLIIVAFRIEGVDCNLHFVERNNSLIGM